MKTIAMFALCLCCLSAQAHHTKDHTMLMENPEQVIAATRAGAGGGGLWLLWAGVFLVLLLGFVRWWKGRK